MKRTILLALTICLFASANAQKKGNIKSKSFEITEATAKNLPKEVSFVNNKLFAKEGYKFEQLASGDYKIIDTKNVNREVSGTYKCNCRVADPNSNCYPVSIPGGIGCGGTACCSIVITIDETKMSNIQMKQN
jgi:hypothetical protein